jgi:hypothetical protein
MQQAVDELLHADIPYRIRIGVVGGRAVSDPDQLSAQIDALVDATITPCSLGERLFRRHKPPQRITDLFDCRSRAIVRRARHTRLAFRVVTSLAEGAERHVTRKLLDLPDVQLDVVLPYPMERCLAELSPESRDDFDALCRRARRPVVLRRVPADPQRARAVAGRQIVDRCDVLIAVRAGDDPSSTPPEVAATVAYAKGKQRPVITIDAGAQYSVGVTPGHGLDAGALRGIECFNAFPIPATRQEAYTRNFCAEILAARRRGSAETAPASGVVQTDAETTEVPEPARRMIRRYLAPFYARASVLAKRNQQLYLGAGLLVYALAPFAVAAVAAAILFESLGWIGFAFEFILLSAILVLVVGADRLRARKHWIESRFLTERLRAGTFLAACGVDAAHLRVAPYRPGLYRSEDWMERAFQEIWGRLPPLTPCWCAACDGFAAFIQRNWIDDQIDYHENNSRRAGCKSRLLERGGIAIFVVALATAACHVVLTWSRAYTGGAWLHSTLCLAALVLPAVGASLGGIRSHREYSRMEKRSAGMVEQLTELKDDFAEVDTPEAFELLLAETEELMLREAQDWLLLMGTARLEAA